MAETEPPPTRRALPSSGAATPTTEGPRRFRSLAILMTFGVAAGIVSVFLLGVHAFMSGGRYTSRRYWDSGGANMGLAYLILAANCG
jgi:hypothetical protein